MQDIQELIHRHEEEIKTLLERKKASSPGDWIYEMTEVKILDRQAFIKQLEGLLDGD